MKQGFSFPGVIAGGLWLLWHQMWGLGALATTVGASIYLLFPNPEGYVYGVPYGHRFGLADIANIGICSAVGYWGNAWRPELARQEEERRYAEARRQLETRQQCLADLLVEAQRWQQHSTLIAYLDELEMRAAQHPHLMTEVYKEGIAVARELATSLLPFSERIKRLSECGMVPNKEIEQPWQRMPALTTR